MRLTVSSGRRNPFGRLAEVAVSGMALAAWLNGLPSGILEQWWSMIFWLNGHRQTKNYAGSSGVGVDVDYHDASGSHCSPPPEVRAAFGLAAERMPGTIWHHTPRGARIAFAFDAICTDSIAYLGAARVAGALITAHLAEAGLVGYSVDEPALLDLARLYYTPKSVVDGAQRDGEVFCIRDLPYNLAELRPTKPTVSAAPSGDLRDATDRYNAENPKDYPANGGDCPICGHRDCFGSLKGDPTRWNCFSSNHGTIGVKSNGLYHGDSLDIDAHAAGMTAGAFLRSRGYLKGPKPTGSAPPEPAGDVTDSYASLCAILRGNKDVIPEPLEFDEMRMCPTIGGRVVDDMGVGKLRELIELKCGSTKDGKALQFSASDIEMAMLQVAKENPYNPVRDYLESMVWDGTARLESVPEDILGAERSLLNVEIIRRWFISAVARAMRPGCKVDTVLILVGDQGFFKSSYFKVLAGADYFSDSPIDIANKDAAMALARCWVQEWAELESMQRARSQNSVKAFLSSSTDTYRPPYSRNVVTSPRHCVIVGTSNDRDILSDPTGNRRYWIVPVGAPVNLELLIQWRDQLWAEAVAAFRAGENWWLDDARNVDLAKSHETFRRTHPWEPLIRSFLECREETTTEEILSGPIGKPAGQWSHGDKIAVAAVMVELGWKLHRSSRDKGRARVWRKA
jgi:hypothetical protein